jgi:hypothetical protein
VLHADCRGILRAECNIAVFYLHNDRPVPEFALDDHKLTRDNPEIQQAFGTPPSKNIPNDEPLAFLIIHQ